jgi:hypothetical protein
MGFTNEEFLGKIVLKLDEYKWAWTTEGDDEAVLEKREVIRRELEALFPERATEAVAYFDQQCFQIQMRNARPSS